MSTPEDTTGKKPEDKNKKRAFVERGVKLRGADKLKRIPIKVEPTEEFLRKPDWIRIRIPSSSKEVSRIKNILRTQKLHTVCEEASCPNLNECFNGGTATFMIMGDICTRRCPFCDVAHGRPKPLDQDEPQHLAESVKAMGLKYVVVTSVDRDDVSDSGAAHFATCIQAIRSESPATQIEILTPDFRGRMDIAIQTLSQTPPDVFNHNLETVPRLYKEARPGADYQYSLDLLKNFKESCEQAPTKSGLMLGLGEEIAEVEAVMEDLRAHKVNRLTLGQYLQPSKDHLAVKAYIHPDEFDRLAEVGKKMGFDHVASGPMVRSSYHADKQFEGEIIK
jgi:lipoic acid synthetase